MISSKISDVVNANMCTGCGICTSESENAKMIWNKEGFLVPDLNSNFSDSAIKVCPFNDNPDEEIKNEDEIALINFPKARNTDERIGRFENIYVGYSKDYRGTSSSGGIATFVFEQLFSLNLIQHLFVVKEINGTYQYQWFNDFNDLKSISKTRYIPVTLENLFKEIDSKEGKVAISGVACFVKAVRLKQYYYPVYRDKISFVIGIICGGLKSKFYSDFLAQKTGIKGEYHKQEYRVKKPESYALDYKFTALDINDKVHSVEMQSLGDMWGSGLFKSNACDFCDDVTTELADISLGDAWLSPYDKDGGGTSVIVARSKLADDIITKGLKNFKLHIEELSLEKFKSSQDGSFKHRQKAIYYRLRTLKGFKPNKRKKFFQPIPIEFKIVQKCRMFVRKKSLEYWNGNISEYDLNVNSFRKKLFKQTIMYHRIQKVKKIIGFKGL